MNARTIKETLNREKLQILNEIDREYSVQKRYPMLFNASKEYINRESKMIRPVVMILIYKAYAKRYSKDIVRSALGFEFLHNCALMHDDIIDDSKSRRGGLSLHKLYESMIKAAKFKNMKGKDLAVISGDIFYALGLKYFMEVKTDHKLKEKAMQNILDTAVRTGLGEFGELALGSEPLKNITKEKIIKIYDLKTAYYTFISPMYTGAILAKTSKNELESLKRIGKYIGRAFQIRNDLKDLDLKSAKKFEDIKQKSKTLLLYYAYKNAPKTRRKSMETMFAKSKLTNKDCAEIARIYHETESVNIAKSDIEKNIDKAFRGIDCLKIAKNQKEELKRYFMGILEL